MRAKKARPADLWAELEWRGLVHQATDPTLADVLGREPVTAYIGFDPTADSLHVGSLLQLCNLRRVQQAGHRAIVLAGGGTGAIGDPGGKSEERPLPSLEQLAANLVSIRPQLERFLDLSGDRGLVVDNGEWLWQAGLIEFLRDVGKHFTINQMVAKESVRTRFEEREQGISFTEFAYMLLQAYDFLQLHDRHGCRLQLGGSDQWGNITMGVELIRKLRRAEAFGLTSPLVLKADGTKFGKTESGTVWLSAERTSPYAFFQFFLGTEDAVVGTYLRYFTWLAREELGELEAATTTRPERREAQRVLARSVTTLVHGADDAARAEHAASVLFEGGDLGGLDEATLLEVFGEVPSAVRSRSDLEGGLSLVELAAAVGLEASRSAARRSAEQGGLYVNGRRSAGPEERVEASDLLHGRWLVLRRGRKAHLLVDFADA